MQAQAGRASYVSADLLTQPDPGAVAVATWMKAVLDKLVWPFDMFVSNCVQSN